MMRFANRGLVLGAGTVLAPTVEVRGRQAIRVEGSEARLLVLLATAYARPVGGEALAHITCAARRWNEGDEALAAVHLALTRLERLAQPRSAARRLFMADGLMKAGATPLAILEALDIDASAFGDLLKYSQDQPRVPKHNPGGGQWTDEAGGESRAVARAPLPASAEVEADWAFSGISAAVWARLGAWALAGAGSAAMGLGLALIPTNRNLQTEGAVKGYPGLRYVLYEDPPRLRLTYEVPNGAARSVDLQPDKDGNLRDPQGKIVGKSVRDDILLIDPATVFHLLTKDDGPSLCPMPTPDRPGRGNPKDRDYEDFVKRLVNPDNPTPRGFGVKLLNPRQNNAAVIFDDCQRRTGFMIDAKGTGYADIIRAFTPGASRA